MGQSPNGSHAYHQNSEHRLLSPPCSLLDWQLAIFCELRFSPALPSELLPIVAASFPAPRLFRNRFWSHPSLLSPPADSPPPPSSPNPPRRHHRPSTRSTSQASSSTDPSSRQKLTSTNPGDGTIASGGRPCPLWRPSGRARESSRKGIAAEPSRTTSRSRRRIRVCSRSSSSGMRMEGFRRGGVIGESTRRELNFFLLKKARCSRRASTDPFAPSFFPFAASLESETRS